MPGDGGDGRDNGKQLFTEAEIAELHLSLSRALLLLGASREADGHRRAAKQLRNTTATAESNIGGEETAGSGQGEIFRPLHDSATADTALRLEMELLSRTPVVLETVESAASLRRSLLGELQHLMKAGTEFWGSIPSPLEVGLRTQFLATYQVSEATLVAMVPVNLQHQISQLLATSRSTIQICFNAMLHFLRQGLNDKSVATALAMIFDKVSGGTMSYYSPHLLWKKVPGEDPGFDGNNDNGTSKQDGEIEQEPPWPRRVPPTATSTATARLQPQEGSKKAATSATSDNHEKRARVGFLSAHFRWHSVGRLTIGLLEGLSNSRSLEIIVIDASIDGRSNTAGQSSLTLQDTPGEQGGGEDFAENPITKRLNAAGISIVRLPAAIEEAMAKPSDPAAATAKRLDRSGTSHNALQNAQQAVAALKLDVLVYGDVGMDALTTGLAHVRLSPVQVAFWGHPGTTGLSTMDYFITSDLFEGELGAGRDGARRAPQSHGRESFPSANAKGVGTKDLIENIPGVGAEDRAEVVDGEDADPLGVAETSNRQNAFSEQLVRLGGLGIVFDDPTRTFRWDPYCGNSNDLSGADTLSEHRPHDGEGPVPREGVARERRQHYGSALELAPPLSRECDGGASPEGGWTKDAATSRPRLYVCAQSLMKMHPAFDAALTGILAADPLAQILLLRDSRQLLWHSRFRRRLRAAVDAAERQDNDVFHRNAATTMDATRDSEPSSPLSRQPVGNYWSRVRFLSPLSGREFFRLQCRADVVLDPFPFGGGVTTLEVCRSNEWSDEPPPTTCSTSSSRLGVREKLLVYLHTVLG